MDGFVTLVKSIVRANGLAHAQLHETRSVLTLPGYFRPTKLWDLIVTHKGRLIAAFEFKSQIGPSFGNNFNNRAEGSHRHCTRLLDCLPRRCIRNSRPTLPRLAHALGGL